MASKRSSLGLQLMSTRKRLELEELFEAFDRDKDGKVSPQELQDMLQSANMATDISAMLKQIHTDEEGNLSFEEFARLMRPTFSTPHRLTKKQQELKDAFDAFDRDGSGAINGEELYAMMKQLGEKITPEEAGQMIKEADHDKDGVINFHEFSLMMGVQPPSSPSSPTSALQSPTSPTSKRKHHRLSLRRFFHKDA
ncbi:hypothetical protein BCR43DRAFT_486670 [Syncephalastrum racemosum]|uniref:EF-hand domain-containing protein n=1 Tax=Syncephalastrum racemosum TaxID=13706 RepID=A0A1X2HQV7_SYNRA|nr:hypothetical protein BCR43DRAFT_486670 [Syncephalastrum racemosum]